MIVSTYMIFLQEYDETMDHLQSDIESLETEKGELREKLKALNKKTLYEALSKSSPLTGLCSLHIVSLSLILSLLPSPM